MSKHTNINDKPQTETLQNTFQPVISTAITTLTPGSQQEKSRLLGKKWPRTWPVINNNNKMNKHTTTDLLGSLTHSC